MLLAVVAKRTVLAEPYEWEPRARCYACATIEGRKRACPTCRGQDASCARCEGTGRVANKRVRCDRCNGEGFVGRKRPPGRMLAIDLGWSDTGHVRLLGPQTPRLKGEALYVLHVCP